MSQRLSQVFAASLMLGALACSGRGSQAEPTYHRDVKALVQSKCAGCHQAGGIAPFALTSLDDLLAHRDQVRSAVATRAMPPWPPAKSCAEYQADRSLTDAQIALITRWVDAGNPAEGQSMETPPGLSRVDLSLRMSAPYRPVLTPDEYRCFVIDWPEQQTKYVTGFRANPGNKAIVHHVIAFLAGPANAAAYQRLADASPTPGYACFGGPGGPPADWIGAWAPGGQGSDFPAGTGIKVQPGSKVILQVHYNIPTAPTIPDQTSIDLKLDASVAKEAVIVPWASPLWVERRMMLIPAGQPDVSYRFSLDPTSVFSRLTQGVIPNGAPYQVYSAALHMHTRGTRAKLEIERAGGAKECVLEIPQWDFHWQGAYDLTQPKTARPGDRLALECHWDNSAANQPIVGGQRQPPRDLNWGEGTNDEMCLGLFYVTP
jgi:mono/diheme cytochrome c family protein